MTEATITTEAGIKSEQAEIKSIDEFMSMWQASLSLGAFCAVSGISAKEASVRACKLRKKYPGLKRFPRGKKKATA